MTTRQLTSRRDAGIALARLYRLARSSRMLALPEARPLARLIVNSVPVPVRNLFLNVSRETGRASGKETAASSASAVTRTGTKEESIAAAAAARPTTSTDAAEQEAAARYRVQAESESVSGWYVGDGTEVEARQDAAAGDVVSGSSSPSSPTLAQRLGRIVDQAAELARWASDTQRRSMHQAVADVAEDVGTIASSALAPVVDAVTRPIERALAPVGSGLGIGLAIFGGLWLLSRR